jgi:sugar O-acyltransferase (sialic acid O-acetyltransferase NeuD family)
VTRVVIIGAGGHGREVAEIMRHQIQVGEKLQLLGFIDENSALHGHYVDGLPVLGNWSWFTRSDSPEVAVICAVGTPSICQRFVQHALALGLPFVSAISPLAVISPRAHVGQGVAVFPGAVINTGAFLDDHCIVNVGATVSHDTRVGRYCNINPGAHLAGSISVGEGCYVGMGSNIIQGRSVGMWTVIGAGAVVIRELPAYVTAVGVPAVIIKTHQGDIHGR